jgi:protein-S-isoprenylcysteine O-methyltransferase Ste14
MTSSIVKTVIFTILVPGTVTVILPRAIGTDSSAPTLYSSIGFLPILLGAAIYLWCAWDFATAGQETPAPIDAPKRLMVRGLYRFVRKPMYVGVLTVLFSESIVFRSTRILTYAIVVFVFFHLMVMLYEEQALKRKFGASYGEYLKIVPRSIPRVVTAPSSRGSVRR